jgi:hypothetical protein
VATSGSFLGHNAKQLLRLATKFQDDVKAKSRGGLLCYCSGRRTGVNYPKRGKNEILGGNEDSKDINKII